MYLTAPTLQSLVGIRHGFFTRRNGVSQGIFAGLNCGYGSSDDVQAVAENRRRAAVEFDLQPSALLSVHQIHGANVVSVSAAWSADARPRADAMVTRRPGYGLGIHTADCAPVLFADRNAKVIGAAHAGWKGALGGVLTATLGAMEQLGAKRESIVAAIGPTIGPASYEVDAGFYEKFLAAASDYGRFFSSADDTGHRHFDLPRFVCDRLQDAGLQNIELLQHDTYAREEDFYSFRRSTHRGEIDYGRQISVIALT